ncbi:MAG: D-2-hydroxyacid dehydrogenase family protein [Alphaproteobacteria bacterium]
MRVHILDDWFDTLRQLDCYKKMEGHQTTIWNDHIDDVDTLAKRLADAEALCLFRERTAIRKALIDRLPNLKLVSQRSVWPHIDLNALTERGVLLCSSQHADTPSFATAELTWALILAAMRQIPEQQASLKAGKWQMGVGKSVRGRTLGLFGYGRIAKLVAEYAKAFGLQVIWWGSEAGRLRAKADGVRVAESRKAFFSEPDIISIHVRLNSATQGLITAQDLAWMRPDSLFVNTSRAGLVEPNQLLAALNAGRPGSAAIDVFENEPLHDENDPLANHPNVVCTPHIGYVTEDEFELQFSDIFDQVNAFEAGKPINVINPEALTPSI